MTQTGTRMREDIELLIDRIYLRGNWLHTDTAHFKRSAVVAAVSAAEKIPAARRLLQGAYLSSYMGTLLTRPLNSSGKAHTPRRNARR